MLGMHKFYNFLPNISKAVELGISWVTATVDNNRIIQ